MTVTTPDRQAELAVSKSNAINWDTQWHNPNTDKEIIGRNQTMRTATTRIPPGIITHLRIRNEEQASTIHLIPGKDATGDLSLR